MSTQDSTRFMGTRMTTGIIWARSPRGSVMYMPSGCLAASTTTLAILAASSVTGSSIFPSDRTEAIHGATRTRTRLSPPPIAAKDLAAPKGDSTRPSARALAKCGHMAMPVTETVCVSRLNICAARLYWAKVCPPPKWDSSRRSVWKAMGMMRAWTSEGPAVSTIRTPRTSRSLGTSRSAWDSSGRVVRQATTTHTIDTSVLATYDITETALPASRRTTTARSSMHVRAGETMP